MSRGRFGLLVALLVLVLGVASFIGVYALLDGGSATAPGAPDPSEAAPASTTTTAPVAPGALVTPTFVAVVSSESDEGAAQAIRDELTDAGYDAGVLRSDDYASLEPGYWVPYVGPFPEVTGADAAKADLIADGYTAAYSRCVGASGEC